MDTSNIQLDKIDFQILTFLQKDGRMSFTDISNEMNVSVGMIRNRYQKMVDNNILHIIGWADPIKIGIDAYARINLKVLPASKLNEVVDKLASLPEVSFVALTSGNYNIEINLMCTNNKHFLNTVVEKIHTIEGVSDSNTTMYLDVKKWASRNF
ncbi:Lrp/AsnC family transcriptional regulator [Flammeovirga aprica]|uniref:Lrp/AsnC family transcriptional regulator n=1 Tax=Flammeovirga aprica JL-4 TaxID=694437 RepID=A0A7X9RZH7_9BACT|nr:Lrp/AsnC family transcriptional regulator [Flammeovirga aprica]NME71657.1 Lrp/AsnC family transcriptional regulator [Flammeovirga aprica JL-4]